MFKKLFTLIELIIVIVIISLMVSIILPNFRHYKREANKSRIIGNIRNIQTAVDMYFYDTGQLPVKTEPDYENPELIDFSLLYPKYLKSIPKLNGPIPEYYWVDVFGQVWGSTVELPNSAFNENGNIVWEKNNERVTGFTLYELENINNGKIKDFTKRYKEILTEEIETNKKYIKITPEENKTYLVSNIDDYGLPTPPASPYLLPHSPTTDTGETLPISKSGVFYFTINAGNKAKWLSYITDEIKPEGSNIIYEFATSDDRENWTQYTSDFYSLKNSQYLRLKATLTANSQGQNPTLKYLYINFKVLEKNEEIQIIKDIDPNQYIEIPEGLIVKSITSNVLGEFATYYKWDTTQDYNTTSYKDTRTIPLQQRKYIKYRFYPSDSYTNRKIDIIYSYEHENNKNYNLIKEIDPANYEPQNQDWENIDDIVYITASEDIGDWISIDVEESIPENTRIVYTYYYSNDINGPWGKASSIYAVPNSKILKIVATRQRIKGTNNTPNILSVFVNYEINGVPKIMESCKTLNENSIVWSGQDMNCNVFDKNPNTYQSIKLRPNETKFISWLGNLKNKTIEIKTGNLENNLLIKFVDKNNNEVEFIDKDTGEKLMALTSYSGKTFKIITPENAEKIKIQAKNIEKNYDFYEIKEVSLENNPVPVTNIIGNSTTNSISLNWENPNSIYDKIYLYRDNKFIGFVTSNSFTDNNLNIGTDYLYELVVLDKNGNASTGTKFNIKTKNNGVIWSGLNSSVFDNDDSTFQRLTLSTNSSIYVTWDKDLTNKLITLKTGIHGNIKVYLTDENNNNLTFLIYDKTNNVLKYVDSIVLDKYYYYIIIPENAKKLKFYSTSIATFDVYTIREQEDIVSPNPVSNITYTSTGNSITLNWTNPDTDFDKVAIFQENNFVGFTNSDSYTIHSLNADTTYNFKLIVLDSTGNISTSKEIVATTQKEEIMFYGLNATVFDKDDSTYQDVVFNSLGSSYDITWSGNLTEKVVQFKNISNGYIYIYVVDNNGNNLEFENYDTNTTTTELSISNGRKIVIPENANKIVLKSKYNGKTTLRLYTIGLYNN